MVLVQFFFIFLIVGLFVIATIMFRILATFNRASRRFREKMGHNATMGSNRNSDDYYSRSTRTETGDTIIDRRPQQKTEQKIFKENEGEYVDYEEEK